MGEYRTLTLQQINEYVKADDAVIDEKFLAHCRRHYEYLIPQFSDLAGISDLVIRYRAVWLLVHLNASEGINRLLSYIRDANDFLKNVGSDETDYEKVKELRDEAISTISDLSLAMSWDLEQSLMQLLLPMLFECKSREDFERVLGALVCVESPQLFEELTQFLNQGRGDQLCFCTIAAINNFRDPRAIDMAVTLLTAEDSHFGLSVIENTDETWQLLTAYLQSEPEGIDEAIVQTLVAFIRNNIDTTDYSRNDKIGLCLQYIPVGVFMQPENQTLLDEILNSRLNKWVKTIAIQRVSELDVAKGCGIVFSVLENNKKDMDAANMLATATKVFKASGADKELSDIKQWLFESFEKDPFLVTHMYNNRFPYWDAYMEVSSASDPLVEKYAYLLDPEEQMRVYCTANDISSAAVVRMVEEGQIFANMNDDHVREFIQKWSSGSLYEAVGQLFAGHGRFCVLDLKSEAEHPDYRNLLSCLEKISDPYFVIPEFSQSWREIEEFVEEDTDEQEEMASYGFEIVFNGHPLSFQIPMGNPLITPDPFISAINWLLADNHKSERFFQLFARDQKIAFVYAPADPFLEIANMIRLPVLADASNIRTDVSPPLLSPLMVDGYSCNYLKLEM